VIYLYIFAAMAEKTYILRMSDVEHKTIKRRAVNSGVTMKQYILDLAVYGKVQHRKPK
jgi:hypothetical protein